MNSTKWIAIFFVSLPVGAVDLSDIRSDIMVNGSSNGISSSSFLKDLNRMKMKRDDKLESYVSRDLAKQHTTPFYQELTGTRDGLFWSSKNKESLHPWLNIDPLFELDYQSELTDIYPLQISHEGLNKTPNRLYHYSYLRLYGFNGQAQNKPFSTNSAAYKNAKTSQSYVTSVTHMMSYLPRNDETENIKIGGKQLNNSPAKHRVASRQKYYPIYDRNYNYLNGYKLNLPLKKGEYLTDREHDDEYLAIGSDQSLVSTDYGFKYRRDLVKTTLDQVVPARKNINGNNYVSSSRISPSRMYFNSVTYDKGIRYFIKPVVSPSYTTNMCRDIIPASAYKPPYEYQEALDSNYDPVDDIKAPIAKFIVSSNEDKDRLLNIQSALGERGFTRKNIFVVDKPLSEEDKVATKNQKEWQPSSGSIRFFNSGRFKSAIENDVAKLLIPDPLKGAVTLGLNDIRLWGYEHPIDVFYQEIRAQRSEADCAIQQTSLNAYSLLTGKKVGKIKGDNLKSQYSFSIFTPENTNALYDLDLSRDKRSKFKNGKYGKGHVGHEQTSPNASMKFYAKPIKI